ncbi:MAG: hypothetical protein BGO40_11895 [Chryseobacterium sp. 39-10]|nr:MAG: hypothetical protein BGO40_11895 [Chryseobacterium sp. 39-10]
MLFGRLYPPSAPNLFVGFRPKKGFPLKSGRERSERRKRASFAEKETQPTRVLMMVCSLRKAISIIQDAGNGAVLK